MPESPSLTLSLPSVPTATITLTNTPYTTFGAASAGVGSINGQLGNLVLSGAGSVYVTNDGRLIIVSGSATTAGGGGTGAVTQAELASTGTILNVKIDALSGWAVNALTQTGVTLIGLINGLGTGGVTSVNSATGAILLTGAGSVSIFRNGSTFTISGLVSGGGAGDVTFSQLAATGSYLESLITGQSGYNTNTYATKTQLTSTGITLGAKVDSVSGWAASAAALASTGQQTWGAANNNGINLSGNLTQTGIALGLRVDTVVSNLFTTGSTLDNKINGLSGYSESTYATKTALAQTGSNLFALINAASAGVSSINGSSGALSLTGAGTATVITNGASFIVSGTSPTSSVLAPPFIYTSGTTVNLSIDSTKTSQNLGIYITGVSTNLAITNQYNGANGVIILNKLYSGTGSVTLPTGSYIINNPSTNVVTLSTGASGYDVLSFIYDNDRPYWAVSTLSGASSSSSASSSGTVLTVTGSFSLSSASVTGIGGVTVTLDGTIIKISGGAGAGTVTQAQLDSVSGFFLTPPQTNLAGGSSLNLNTIYYDTLGGTNRTLSFNGSPSASSFVTLRANLTGYSLLTIPSSYRIGSSGTITSLDLYPGNHEISWIYSDSEWWLADSVGYLSNYSATSAPTTGENIRYGFGIGSQWLTTGDTGLYQCVSSSTSGATWIQLYPTSGGQGTVTASQLESTGQAAWTAAQNNAIHLSGNLTQTGSILIGLINAASAGVSSINGASGVITVEGAGNVSVITNGQTLTISGNTGAYAGFASKLELTATGQTLGSRIDITNANVLANATNLSGRLATTGSQLYSMAAAISGNLTQTGVTLGSQINTVSTNTTANANNLSGRLTATGGQLFSMASSISGNLTTTGSRLHSFATSISGNLIQTGVTLGSQITTVITNTTANAINLSGRLAATGSQLYSMTAVISGNLTQTGVTLGNQINTVSSNTIANGLNLSGNLTQTGVSLGSRITTVETNTTANATNLSGRLATTGSQLYTFAASNSGNLIQTGIALGSSINTVATNTQNNALNLSGHLTATGQLLSAVSITGSSVINSPIFTGIGGVLVILSGDRTVLISGGAGGGGGVSASQLEATGQAAWIAADNNARNLSGNLTTTGTVLWQRDLDISGALASQIGAANAGVTSVNGLTGVISVNGVGQVAVTTAGSIITVSGIDPSSGILSPAFVQASGTHVTLTVNPLKASQNLELLATGVNTVLTVTGMFNGANGVVLVTKLYEGTGSITLQSDSKIINSLNTNIVTLSTGSGVWDALSFICDNTRPYWAVSTLSGAAGGGVGDVTSAQLASTGQQAWTAADNNARNLSGNLTLTGVSLGGRVDTLTSNLTQTGATLIERDILISGALVTGMSPAFISISGTAITIPVSRSKAAQQYKLLATGDNTTLTITNAYNGANGVIIVDKSFEGTGALILPAGAVVINGGGINAVPYSTGIGYDAFSFVYDEVRSYWAVSSLSGASSAAQQGGGTNLSVTGSSALSSADLSGIGGTLVILSGTSIFISGAGGGGPAAPTAGNNTEIIFNNAGTYSGDSRLKWEYQSGILNVNNSVIDGSGINLPSGYSYRINNQPTTFTKGGAFYNRDGLESGNHKIVTWYAPFNCTAVAVRGYVISGTNATIQAQKNSSNLMNQNMLVSPAATWVNSGILQNNTFVPGDSLALSIIQSVNGPQNVTIQVDFIKV